MAYDLNDPAPIERASLTGAVLIPPSLIKPNPWNRKPSEAHLADLAASVRKHGVLQPVLVRPIDGAKPGQPLYELVAGERRWRAAQMAEVADLPCLVRPMDDLEVIELMLVENLEREELHPLDEAAGYDRLLRKDSGPQALRGFATVDALADRIGKSRSYVVQRLKLLTLCEQAALAFRENDISFSIALRIARLPDHSDQVKALGLAHWGGEQLSAREFDEEIRRNFHLSLKGATFPIASADLVPDAGACTSCPKRAGNAPDLFDDTDADTCTDGACYQAKTEAHAAALRAEAEAKGLTVISGAEAKKLKPTSYGEVKGLLALDETHHRIDGNKPLRKLLGKAEVKPVLFQDPHTHQLVEMVPADQALKALKDKGVIQQAKMPGTSASERSAEEKRKAENEWRGAVAEACIKAARGEQIDSDYGLGLIRRVAVTLWHELHNDTRVRITKMLGWPPLKARWDHGAGVTALEHIGVVISDAELCAYFTAVAIHGDSHAPQHMGTGQKPETLLAVAAELGVDAAAVKASLAKPKKAAAPGKAKPEVTPETALAGALKAAKDKPAKPAAKKAAPKGPAIKYRNALTGETWTGRGLQPKWLKVALADGKTLADFAI